MATGDDRRLGMIFGLLGGLLIVLDGLLRGISGAVLLAIGRSGAALGAWEHGILLIIGGLLLAFFAFYGRRGNRDRSLAAGVILIVLPILGWFVLGFGSGILSLVGAVLALIAGLLYLVSGR